MLELIVENADWIFSGIGVAVVTGIIAFLFREKTSDTPPQVVMHIHPSKGDRVEQSEESTPAKIERISRYSHSDIMEAVANAPALHQDDIRESFVGLRVEWETVLLSAKKADDDLINLTLAPDNEFTVILITCRVSLADYRELGVLSQGAKIRVDGTISKVDIFSVELDDVTLYFREST